MHKRLRLNTFILTTTTMSDKGPELKKRKRATPTIAGSVAPRLTAREHKALLAQVDEARGYPDNNGCSLVKIGGAFSQNAKGYVQIKAKAIKGDTDNSIVGPNTKVQLHQLIAWNRAPFDRVDLCRKAILKPKIDDQETWEISHLCSNKTCASAGHLVAETSWVNKSRWHCPVVVVINGKEVPCCRHEPACIATSVVREKAWEYAVVGDKVTVIRKPERL